jgi:very-short-patch-repair endonuclease
MTRIYNRSDEKFKRQALRANMPLPEIILWSRLKGKGIGYKFRRQHSVGSYVLDFCCPVLKLAIEIDGSSHFTDEALIRDRARQKVIESYGFSFLRFTNAEVGENVDGVVSKIKQYLCEITTPPPPCQGGDKLDGEVAGKARQDLEKKTGKKVVASVNYLAEPESRKRLERK